MSTVRLNVPSSFTDVGVKHCRKFTGLGPWEKRVQILTASVSCVTLRLII